MKKKIWILLVIIIVLAILVGAIVVTHIIPEEESIIEVSILNSGYEGLDQSGRPEFWKEDSRGGWFVDTENPYDGEVCMQATVSWSWLSQEIPVNPGKYYLLKAYTKSNIVIRTEKNYQNTFLTLECLDKNNRVINKYWGIVNAVSSWQQKEVLIASPDDTKKIRVKLAKRQGEGSVWFDNLELIEISSAKEMLNPGFEELNGSNKPKFWREDSRGGWFIDTSDPYEGEICMRATVAWSYLMQEIPVDPNSYYALRSYVKSDIIIPEEENYCNTFLTLECLDKDGKVIDRYWGIVNAISSWQLKEVAMGIPKNTRMLRIKLAKRQGKGSVWFDNLELVKLPSYLRIYFIRKILQDKPFFIFYGIIYTVLIVLLIRIIIKEIVQGKRG